MMKVELIAKGPKGLAEVYLKNGNLSHKTGNKIKLLPFRTKFLDACMPDLQSFQGVVGECFRLSNNQVFDKSFSTDKDSSFRTKLRNYILKEVMLKVDTEKIEEFKNIVNNLFFEEDRSLIKFNREILPYMNFILDHAQLNETARFFYEIFLDAKTLSTDEFTSTNNDNLFYQLIVDCLPELKTKKTSASSSRYNNIFEEIKTLFLEDFHFLSSDEETFLEHIEDLFKYYYFFYLTQLVHRFKLFGARDEINPIYFSMDWETLSESRMAYQYGWKKLADDLDGLFAHANTIELLNYIHINGDQLGDYKSLRKKWFELSSNEQDELIQKINELSKFYTENVGGFNAGENWDKCEIQTKSFLERNSDKYQDKLSRELVSFYRRVKYQFDHSDRKAAHDRYGKWLINFCKINYTKTRGRLGSTTVLDQELLLFLTKLCVGKKEKIRLNELWDKLKERGLSFDEPTKGEIIKLFERINLIEKKSDSGDAQYVKSIV